MVSNSLKKLKRLVVAEEIVALTGSFEKALVLGWFMSESPWVEITLEGLCQQTMLNKSPQTMKRHINYLVQKGWLERRHNPTTKVYQYRANLGRVQEDLIDIGYQLETLGYTGEVLR